MKYELLEVANPTLAIFGGNIINTNKVTKFIESNKINEYVFIGNLFLNNNLELLNYIKILSEKNKCYVLLSKEDLRFIKNNYEKYPEQCRFALDQHIILSFMYENRCRLILTAGGIDPNIEKYSDIENLDGLYIKDNLWHKKYKGQIGYIVSSIPKLKNIKLYSYSASIGLEQENCFSVLTYTKTGIGETLLMKNF